MSSKPQPLPDTVITIQLKDSGEALEQSGTLIIKRGDQAVMRAITITTADDLTGCIVSAALDIQAQERAAAEKAEAAKAEKSAAKASSKKDTKKAEKPAPKKPVEKKSEQPAAPEPLKPALATGETQLSMF